ncbi:MFS transporter [Salidesulfovibrio onnuriiensis]|uniref:MFS transporter n=1 Tax=Salidesulfovibrio onnuriiensis TaxID=2583823 RepID=UPI0011C73406|nr:MFS transporter [Salidesulfovibrio onnuriiensis]
MRLFVGVSGRGSTAWKMFLLACMYLCQAIPLGYVFGSLPVIMRENRMSLESVGGLFILHLPWAFKFLYASRVDRTGFARLGRRRSWILPLQWAGAGLLLAVAGLPPETDFRSMYMVLLALNVVMATNDIAVDGYATDMLEPGERAWGNVIQAGARYVGMILGGGVMLFLHSSLGWGFLCRVLAATVFLFSLPVLLHRELAPVSVETEDGDGSAGGVLAFLRRRQTRFLLLVLIAPTAFAFCGFMMHTPLLVDLGLSSRDIGGLLMHYGYPAGLAGTVLCGWLLHRAGRRTFLRAFCLAVILLCAFTVHCIREGGIAFWQAAMVLSLDNFLMGGINVWGFTLMMRASAGPHAGVGFAVLSSLFILVPLATAPLWGRVGDLAGFGPLYALLGALTLAGFVAAEAGMRLERKRSSGTVLPEGVS